MSGTFVGCGVVLGDTLGDILFLADLCLYLGRSRLFPFDRNTGFLLFTQCHIFLAGNHGPLYLLFVVLQLKFEGLAYCNSHIPFA